MATFKTVILFKRKDGFYPVYIRVSHRRKLAYIPTDKFVRDSVITRSGEIEDPYVLQYCSRKIIEFVEKLNKVDIEHWNVGDVVNFLKSGEADISFSDYARLHIERCSELIEQFIILRLEITLIEVIADDESFKRYFGEVSRESVLAVDFGYAHRHGRDRAEPVEVSQQFGECYRCNLKQCLTEFHKVSPVFLTADNLCAAPLEQAKGLDFVGGEIIGEKLINIAKLFIRKLVPAMRYDEVNRDCLHIKSALSYCESTVKHSMGKRQKNLVTL